MKQSRLAVRCAGWSTSPSKSQIPRVAVFRQPVLRFIRWCHDSIPALLSHRKNGRRRRRAPNKKVAAGTILLGRDSRPRWLLNGQGKVTFKNKFLGRRPSFFRATAATAAYTKFLFGSAAAAPPQWSGRTPSPSSGRPPPPPGSPPQWSATATIVGPTISTMVGLAVTVAGVGRVHRHGRHGRPYENLYGRPWRSRSSAAPVMDVGRAGHPEKEGRRQKS